MKIIYTLVETLEDARKIACVLVEEKLAACVNITPGILSVYEWDSKLVESSEYALVIKVTHAKHNQAIQKLESIHPYEIPAILSFAPESVNLKFEQWS